MNPNFKNRTIFTGDNLDIMRGMNSQSVDLVYLDPPFNSGRNYEAPIGSEAAGAHFKDAWTLDDIDLAWHGMIAEEHPAIYQLVVAAKLAHGGPMMSYLIYMAMRLLEIKRVLKDTGSIYLHCDPTASHYLKMIMDAIFGKSNFRNEVVWCYTGPSNSKKDFSRKHDIIFRYVNGDNWVFNVNDIRVPYKQLNTNSKGSPTIKDTLSKEKRDFYLKKGKVPESWWTKFSPVGRIKNERMGYPTQKPLALLERIIKASSNEGDVVLDPFCGCATTCIAAERLNRQWIGIDLSELAAKLIQSRVEKDLENPVKIITRSDIPKRTDQGKFKKYNDKDNKQILYGKQEGLCNGCRHFFPYRNFTVDHIVPQSKGGTDHPDNLQLLCGACNSMKGSNENAYLIAELTRKGILS